MPFKKWLNDHNRLVSSLGISLLVVLLNATSLGLYKTVRFPYLRVENTLQDWVARLGKPAPRDDRICFLYDDTASRKLDHLWEEDFEAAPILRKMKNRSTVQVSWPRDVYGAILEKLVGAGARVVGFDYFFEAESPTDDPLFKEALDRYKDRVVVGGQLEDADISLSKSRTMNPPTPTLIPDVRDPRVGFVNVFPDADNVLRRFFFRLTLEELAGFRAPPDATVYESLPARMLGMAGLSKYVPSDREPHQLRFAYRGETRRDMMRPESVANIFVQSIWEANYQNGAFFKDKIVLVGPTGNLHKDFFNSPFGVIGGPEAHLNVMHGLLTGSFLQESPEWLDWLLILGGGLFALVLGQFVRNPILRMGVVLLIGVAFFYGAVWLLDHGNLVIQVFSPLLSLFGSTFGFVVWQQLIERIERAKLRRTFERYVSRDVVKELVDNPESYLNTVGGARKAITVLFSDIRGFTTMTESGDPQAVVAQLNEYFDTMVGIVFDNRGTLDKFIGDAVMAQWGGITTEGAKQDAINAVRSAVQMRKDLAKMNPRWIAQGKIELSIGIGINHGEAIVGNLGSTEKAEISAIGDVVNTASRLEGMTKVYRCDLLIGETVEELVRDTFIVRTVGRSQPKGKTRPLEIFTVIDERTNGASAPPWLGEYEDGVTLYRNREFAAAAERFRAVLRAVPGDWLCEDYLANCELYLKEPPPPEWNAVEVMESK